jgi:hypothetical protein
LYRKDSILPTIKENHGIAFFYLQKIIFKKLFFVPSKFFIFKFYVFVFYRILLSDLFNKKHKLLFNTVTLCDYKLVSFFINLLLSKKIIKKYSLLKDFFFVKELSLNIRQYYVKRIFKKYKKKKLRFRK